MAPASGARCPRGRPAPAPPRRERQSPIDIDRIVVVRRLAPLRLQLHETPLAPTNNGHTIEEESEPGSTLGHGGVVYDLTQFHLHTLSEHTVAGRHGVMELHAVFADPASESKPCSECCTSLDRRTASSRRCLPTACRTTAAMSRRSLGHINVADSPTHTACYHPYPGSLTTPPGSETVTWLVLHDVAQLSNGQFEAFRTILGNNFRPLQKLNARTIRSSVADFDRQHR